MSFVKYHPRLGDHKPKPDCTIFNYDIIVFLCKEGPVIYEFNIGGYIAPNLGGNFTKLDWFFLKDELKKYNPSKIIIPECLVNNYYPDEKVFVEQDLREMGYFGDTLIVYLQKEQNFYYKEIYDTPDWFYTDERDYRNIVYHSIGYNTPTEPLDEDRFKNFKFCKQGFLCETFKKLYYLRHTTPLKLIEDRKKANIKPGKLIWYGNLTTSIRDNVHRAIEKSNKLEFVDIHYGDENLSDLVLSKNGIGLSMDGLVFNTIRDSEFGLNALPSIKVTRADDYLIDQNNINMWGYRDLIQVQPDIFNNFDIDNTINVLEEGYEKYMDEEFHNYEKVLKNVRYQYFISLLQKFNNIDLFIYDILFGYNLYEFILKLPLDVKFDIFESCANPEYIAKDLQDKLSNNFISSILSYFDQNFKTHYNEWYSQ